MRKLYREIAYASLFIGLMFLMHPIQVNAQSVPLKYPISLEKSYIEKENRQSCSINIFGNTTNLKIEYPIEMYAQDNMDILENLNSTTIIDSLKKGDVVTIDIILKYENEKWYRIQLSSGQYGFVKASMLGENEPVVEKKAVATQSTPKASTSQSTSQPQASNSAPSSNDIDAMLDALGGQSMNMTYTETNYDTAYSGDTSGWHLQ